MPNRSRQAMTLIEIMVAIAIMAIVSTLLYSGFVQTSRNKQIVENELDRYHEITSGIGRMAEELSMAYCSVQRNTVITANWPVFTGLIAKEGNGTRIDFTSFSHRRLYRDAHESDQNELSYFVMQDPKTSHNVLARREQRRVDDNFQKGGQTQILIDNVKALKVSFLDPLTTEWVTTWDTTQATGQTNRLPSQAKIFITVPNVAGKGPDQTFGTRTNFPITYALNFSLYSTAH